MRPAQEGWHTLVAFLGLSVGHCVGCVVELRGAWRKSGGVVAEGSAKSWMVRMSSRSADDGDGMKWESELEW